MRISVLLSMLSVLLLANFVKAQTIDEVRLDFYKENISSRQVGMDVSGSGRYVAFAFEGGTIRVFDSHLNKFISSFKCSFGELFELRFVSSESKLVLVSPNEWQVVDWKTGETLHREKLSFSPTKVDVAHENDWLAIGTMDCKLLVYDLNSMELIFNPTLEYAKKYVRSLEFSKGDKYLMSLSWVSGSKAPFLEVFEMASKQKVVGAKGGYSDFSTNTNLTNPKQGMSTRSVAAFSDQEESVVITRDNFKSLEYWNFMEDRSDIDWISPYHKEVVFSSSELMGVTDIVAYEGRLIGTFKSTGFMVMGEDGKTSFSTRRDRAKLNKESNLDWRSAVNATKRIGKSSKFLINPFGTNVNYLFDIDKLEVIGYIYTDANADWAVVSRDGRVDGTIDAFSNLYWTERKSEKKLPLDVNLASNISPKLFAELVNEEGDYSADHLTASINMAPSIKITSPSTGSSSSQKTIEVAYLVTSNGDPVKSVDVTVNGKKLGEGTRGFVKKGSSISVSLIPGHNAISLTAVSEKGYESISDQIVVNFAGTPAKSELYLLTIGVNDYKNPKYSLNYANADAEAFESTMTNGGTGIFEDIKQYHIENDQATKANIEATFDQINLEIGPEDVFVFYYAGHGVMSVDEKPKFYIVPHEVTRLYGDNLTLGEKAISADQLKAFSSTLSAQKQLFVLDACQSGGMTEMLAMRGAAEERAIAQLARSTGTYWLTASGSEQFATEFASLGHGLFTYSLLQGLQGAADGGSMDKKITVKELSAFLDEIVPELSEQHKGQAQYPTSYGFGQDFPIVVVE